MGDFNINLLNWQDGKCVFQLMNLFKCYGRVSSVKLFELGIQIREQKIKNVASVPKMLLEDTD